MRDILAQHLIPVRELPDLLPRRRGKKIHLSTIYRWIESRGTGRKLEAVRIGGVLYTTREALDRFAVPVTHSALPKPAPAFPARAGRILDQAKIGGKKWERPV